MKARLLRWAALGLLAAVLFGCAGCQPSAEQTGAQFPARYYLESGSSIIELGMEEVPLAASPAVSTVLMPAASGTTVYSNADVAVDASNSSDGYIMIKFTGSTSARLKVIVQGPKGTKYTYNLNNGGTYEVFPLSDGSGSYTVGVYKNVSGTKYSTAYSASFSVALNDEFAPFLRPNQYVNYTAESNVVKKAQKLVKDCETELDKVTEIYEYVIGNISYDKKKAKTVKSGYLPDLDAVLKAGKGICFDYAAVMAAMLRSQGIPAKLVVGYTGELYHAWISAYTEETGWVEGIIFFDGTTWKLMDPTFASSGSSSREIMDYIGNTSNYQAKYLY